MNLATPRNGLVLRVELVRAHRVFPHALDPAPADGRVQHRERSLEGRAVRKRNIGRDGRCDLRPVVEGPKVAAGHATTKPP